MIERLEVTPGAGTVIRYGGIVAWADPSASAALISFLAQSARNLSPSPRGGRQIADHIAGVLASRDPEPHVAFAVIGPSDHGWASLLHGPVQAWDGARWLAPTPTPGWLQAIITPRPAITVSAAGTPTPAPEPDAMWDLEAGVVPGSGFVLIPAGVPGRYANVHPPLEDHLHVPRDLVVPDVTPALEPEVEPDAAGGAQLPVERVAAVTTALPAVEPTLLLGPPADAGNRGRSRAGGELVGEPAGGEVRGGVPASGERAGEEPAPPAASGAAAEGGAGGAAEIGAALGAAALRGRRSEELARSGADAGTGAPIGEEPEGEAAPVAHLVEIAGEPSTGAVAVGAGAAAAGGRAGGDRDAATSGKPPDDPGAAAETQSEGRVRSLAPESGATRPEAQDALAAAVEPEHEVETPAASSAVEPEVVAGTATPQPERQRTLPVAAEPEAEAPVRAAPGPEGEPQAVAPSAAAGAPERELTPLPPGPEPGPEPQRVAPAPGTGVADNGESASVGGQPASADGQPAAPAGAGTAGERSGAAASLPPETVATGPQPPAVPFSRPRRPPAPGPAGSVDLRTVATTAGSPLPRGGGPDQRIPGAAVVAGTLCARGHLNRPGLAVCARCRTVLPDGAKDQVSGTRPPLGVLVSDDGTIYRLDRGYLVGSAPGRDPTVGGGLARPLVLPGSDVSGSHAELRLADWDVLIVDRGSAAGTCVFEPGASEWARLNPFEPRVLPAGTHIAFGQRIVTYLSPWIGPA